MQKFVVSPSIAGAHLSLAAAKYLVTRAGIHDEVSHEPDNFLNSKLLTDWWHIFNEWHSEVKQDELLDDDEIRIDTYGPGLTFRNNLLPYLESLEGDYDTLDLKNDGNRLRIVEVPDGYDCAIVSDPEMGIEEVVEHRHCFPVPGDEIYKDVLSVRKFCKSIENGTTTVQDLTKYTASDVTLAFIGDYGAARRSNGDFMFLHKNTYYRSTEDHGTVCYEIEGDRPPKFITQKVIYEAQEIAAYSKLINLLNAE